MKGRLGMMQRIRNLRALLCGIVSVFVLLAAVSRFPFPAYAAETAALATIETAGDYTVIVGYDTEKPKVVFIDPNNKQYNSDKMFAEIIEAEKATYYYISNAAAGDWRMEYDKGANSEISVDVVPWHKGISAQSLTFETEMREGEHIPYLNIKLLSDYGERSYRYTLSAVITDANGVMTNQIFLADGGASGGQEAAFTVHPNRLPDGEYHLFAEVYAEDASGTEVRDSILTEGTFRISGNTTIERTSCLKITCDTTDGMVTAAFNAKDLRLNVEEYALMILQGGKQLAAKTSQDAAFEEQAIVDPDGGDITVQVNGKDRSGSYRTWSKTFSPKFPFSLSIETPAVTNELNAVIAFDAGEKTYAGQIALEGASKNVQFSGKNKAQVSLQSMSVNELEIRVADQDVLFLVHQRISVDTVPPLIDIFGATDNMVVSGSKITFVGMTDAGAALSCNGEKLSPDPDGSFTVEKSVDSDGSDFKFEASDEAGNVSVRVIHVARGSSVSGAAGGSSMSGWLKALIALGVAALYAFVTGVLAIAICKRREKKHQTPHALQAVLLSFAVVLIVSFAGLGTWQLYSHFRTNQQLSGSSLVEMLKSSSTSDVASKIDAGKSYLYSAIISYAVAVLLIAAIVCSAVFAKRRKKTDAPEQQP